MQMTKREQFNLLMDRANKERAELEAQWDRASWQEMLDLMARPRHDWEKEFGDLRSDTDLDIILVWPDKRCAQYICVHTFMDEESPDGVCHDLQTWTAYDDPQDCSWFDAGALWGYWCAKDAAEAELGFEYDENAAVCYDVCREKIAASFFMFETVTFSDVMNAVSALPSMKWSDVKE